MTFGRRGKLEIMLGGLSNNTEFSGDIEFSKASSYVTNRRNFKKFNNYLIKSIGKEDVISLKRGIKYATVASTLGLLGGIYAISSNPTLGEEGLLGASFLMVGLRIAASYAARNYSAALNSAYRLPVTEIGNKAMEFYRQKTA